MCKGIPLHEFVAFKACGHITISFNLTIFELGKNRKRNYKVFKPYNYNVFKLFDYFHSRSICVQFQIFKKDERGLNGKKALFRIISRFI